MKRLGTALLAAAMTASGCAGSRPDFAPFSNAWFTADTPSDWTVSSNAAGANPGVQFLAPSEPGKRRFRRSITVDFYPPDDRTYPTPKDFIAANTLSLPGFNQEEMRSVLVAGIPGQETVWRKPLPLSTGLPAKTAMRTRAVILPYAGGFFALRDTHLDKEPADASGVFSRLLESFRPIDGAD